MAFEYSGAMVRKVASLVAMVVSVWCEVSAAAPAKLGVLIVVDQLSAEHFAARLPSAKAGIKRLVDEGFRVDALVYGSAPTVTSAGHATLATGTYPDVHGIVANDWFEVDASTDAGRLVSSVQDERFAVIGRSPKPRDGTSPWRLRAPTLGDALKASSPDSKVVAISAKDRSAILPGGHAADLAVWMENTGPRFVTSDYYPGGLPDWARALNEETERADAGVWPHKSYFLADPVMGRTVTALEVRLALSAVAGMKLGADAVPDLLVISFSSFDALLHDQGPDTPAAAEAFAAVDTQVGVLLAGLDKLVGRGAYVVAFTSDHGGMKVPETLVKARLPAGRLDAKGLKEALEKEADDALGSGDWFFGHSTPGFYAMPGARERIHGADERLAKKALSVPGVFALWPLPDLLSGRIPGAVAQAFRRGAFPTRSPDFVLVQRPYWLHTVRDQAAHSSPWAYDAQVPLVLFGAQVRKGSAVSAAAVDVAPTLAALLGRPPPAASEGRVLSEALSR